MCPAPGQSTWDGNPNTSPPITSPYRPGIADFNGAALTDDPINPPDPATMPTSALLNTDGYLLVSIGKMVANASISINASASPTVAFWTTAANKIGANPFTVTRNSVGNYSLTFAAGTFPAPTSAPRAYLNVLLTAHNYSIGAINIVNGVQVTTTQDGALADLNFTVDLF